ncbi:putative amidoligase domain-containing protein [Cohnella fermenti]|uniref:PhiEco32-like amidoligase-type 2 protein n=1 Tax=Cohnella fermenti TaxID=2565925 RepID=A0A4S4BJ11_9BACL|nr:hypothetical protein [Cohnella fermenti]THF74612.1 hypothetical protein E6C55_24750 [Cohnella fermenti]
MAGRIWLIEGIRPLDRQLRGEDGGSGIRNGLPEPGERLRGDVLIRLGRDEAPAFERFGQAQGAWLWNGRAEQVLQLGQAETARRLRREGFVTAFSAERDVRRATGGRPAAGPRPWKGPTDGFAAGGGASTFRVFVFGLDTAHVEPYPLEFRRARELERRLARASARALYVLGLDSGTVVWRVGRDGRLGAISSLSPWLEDEGEEWREKLGEGLASFANDWAVEHRMPVRVTLGADPEFALLSAEGKIVPASRYLPKRGAAGCDSMRVGGTIRWPLGELRPTPSADPKELAEALRRLLARSAALTAGAAVSFRAGAAPVRGLPLGGHLHVSGAALTGERLRALDNAVALPLRLLEPPEANRRRPRYGSLGDYRPKSHGGFEYRTPPSWLVSPRLARGTLALAKVAAEHSRLLADDRPLDDDRMRDAFYGGDRRRLMEGAERIYQAVRETPGYAAYREEIDPLFRAIGEGRHWDETVDLRRKWRIPIPYSPPTRN